jgi:hypothetical protein
MLYQNLKAGSVVQLTLFPTVMRGFAVKGQFLIVDKARRDGVSGYFVGDGLHHYETTWGEVEFVGPAPFNIAAGDDDTGFGNL